MIFSHGGCLSFKQCNKGESLNIIHDPNGSNKRMLVDVIGRDEVRIAFIGHVEPKSVDTEKLKQDCKPAPSRSPLLEAIREVYPEERDTPDVDLEEKIRKALAAHGEGPA